MSEAIPKAIWSGTFEALGVTLHCHVLDNGQLVIEHDSMMCFLAALADSSEQEREAIDMDAFVRWQRGQ